MIKEELVLQIVRAMFKGHRKLGSLNAYLCINGYLLDLEIEDLIGIGYQYGINDIVTAIK